MNKLIGVIGAAFFVAATPAMADPLLFTLTGNDDTASFVLDSNPTGTAVTNADGSQDFEIDNVAGSFSGVGDGPSGNNAGPQTVGDLQFYTGGSGGGIEVNETNGFGIFSLEGDQLFSGNLDDPTFAPGSFNFTQDFFYGPTNETLTITAVSAAPEPGAWVLMMAGVGLMGAALRRPRRPRRALAAA